MQLPIDTDPLPPNGSTPHPLSLAPHHWMGNGMPPFPRHDHGHDMRDLGLVLGVRTSQGNIGVPW
jgi:hypothetical protein